MLINVNASRRRAAQLLVLLAPLACLGMPVSNAAAAPVADEAAIPVRKNAPTATESAAAETQDKPAIAKSTAPESSFYTLQQTDKPLGLLKKRTGASSSNSAEPAAAPPAPAPSPAAAPPTPAAAKENPRPAPTTEEKPEAAPKLARSSRTDSSGSGSSSASSSRHTDKAQKSSSPDSLQADLAAVAILRTDKTSAGSKADDASSTDADPDGPSSSSKSPSGDESAAASDQGNSTTFSGDSNADAAETNDAGFSPAGPVNDAMPALPASMAQAPAPAAPAPNLYLPQSTPRSGGFLSRLFHRDRSRQTGTAATAMQVPMNFNSDYATRGSDDVCPVVLPGLGINGADIPIGSEDAYRLTSSLPTNFRPTDLVLLPNQYCHYGNPLYLRREAAASLCQMISAAAQQGYTIRVVSAFRDYSHQMRLYTQAVARGGENQKSVARPGRSEHYLGTTVDLTNNEAHALKRSFGDTPEGKWLAANAGRFGWKMTVMSSNARRSHNEEPWHLRYLGDTINNPGGISPVAQQSSPPQRRDVFGSIGRFLGLRR